MLIEVNIYRVVETVIPPTKMWLIRACSVAQYSQRQELLCRLLLCTDHQPLSLECSCAAHTPGVGGFGSATCLLLLCCLSPTLPSHHKHHKRYQTGKYCHFLGWDSKVFDLEFLSFSPLSAGPHLLLWKWWLELHCVNSVCQEEKLIPRRREKPTGCLPGSSLWAEWLLHMIFLTVFCIPIKSVWTLR